jgi:lipoate-protein ligase A
VGHFDFNDFNDQVLSKTVLKPEKINKKNKKNKKNWLTILFSLWGRGPVVEESRSAFVSAFSHTQSQPTAAASWN